MALVACPAPSGNSAPVWLEHRSYGSLPAQPWYLVSDRGVVHLFQVSESKNYIVLLKTLHLRCSMNSHMSFTLGRPVHPPEGSGPAWTWFLPLASPRRVTSLFTYWLNFPHKVQLKKISVCKCSYRKKQKNNSFADICHKT